MLRSLVSSALLTTSILAQPTKEDPIPSCLLGFTFGIAGTTTRMPMTENCYESVKEAYPFYNGDAEVPCDTANDCIANLMIGFKEIDEIFDYCGQAYDIEVS